MDVCNQRRRVSPGQRTALAVKRRACHTQAAKTAALAEDAPRMRLDRISGPFMCEVRVDLRQQVVAIVRAIARGRNELPYDAPVSVPLSSN